MTECLQKRTDLPPLVSVITPTYRTGELIERPYNSLRGQSYPNWEWILVEDSDDNGETFRMLSDMAHRDHRLGVFRHHGHSGVIGKVKRWACRLANGQILVELDHDDEITPRALEYVVEAFRHFDGSTSDRPLAGFVYTDFAEIYPDGSPVTYSDDWAFGYGSYRWETIGGYNLAVPTRPTSTPRRFATSSESPTTSAAGIAIATRT